MISLSEKLTGAIEDYAVKQGVSVQDGLKVSRASLNGDSFAADVLRVSILVPTKDENDNIETKNG